PDFVIDTTLKQMKSFADTKAADATLVNSVAKRAHDKGVDGDWAGRATRIYDAEVLPALQRQMQVLQGLRAKAVHTAGVARLPEGQAYYRVSLKNWTTTDLPPAEVHRLGLEQVKLLNARLDEA